MRAAVSLEPFWIHIITCFFIWSPLSGTRFRGIRDTALLEIEGLVGSRRFRIPVACRDLGSTVLGGLSDHDGGKARRLRAYRKVSGARPRRSDAPQG